MKKYLFLLFVFVSLFVACQPAETPESVANEVATEVPVTTAAVEIIPTATDVPPTKTSLPPTETPPPPTATAAPTATPTPVPSPTPNPYPAAQGYHGMAYDSESDLVIMVPMHHRSTLSMNTPVLRTWVFDLNTKTWQHKDSVPPMGEGSLAYDSQSDRMIYFVGSQIIPSGYQYNLADGQTWAYDANTDTWTQMEPAESPWGVLGARMVYDAESDRMILFGGMDPETTAPKYETWAYDYETNTWTQMQPATDPPQGVLGPAMTYDSVADRVIMWFYDTSRGENPYKIGLYDYNANTWEIRDAGRLHPTAISSTVMVYDPQTNRSILFGGEDIEWVNQDETWEYDYATNSWKRIRLETQPSARINHAMVCSTQEGLIMLFGGSAIGSETNWYVEYNDETWVFDLASREWADYSNGP